MRSVPSFKRMSELGGSVIDTAAAYGDSEALIGEALESLGTHEQDVHCNQARGQRIRRPLRHDGRRQLRAITRAAERYDASISCKSTISTAWRC